MSDGTHVHTDIASIAAPEPAPRPRGALRQLVGGVVAALVGDYGARLLIAAASDRGVRAAREYSDDDVRVTSYMARAAFGAPERELTTRQLRRIHRRYAGLGGTMSLRSFAEALAAGEANLALSADDDYHFAILAARHFMRVKYPHVSSTLLPSRFSPDTAEVLL